jgi:protein-disulfide isomerase
MTRPSTDKSGGAAKKTPPPKKTPPSKKANQARERANARRVVEQQRARERRRRVTLWTTIGVVLVLLISGLVGYGVMAGQQKNNASNLTTPSVAVDNGTAFAVGTGPVTIDLYEDFMCPICHEFENASGATIKQLVAENKVTVRYHTVAILDGSSNGTQYSTRAAGAAAAAAEGGKFIEYHDVLFANQPQEGTDGLTDAKLIDLGKSVGLTSASFADAVNNKTYDAWVGQVTDSFSQHGFTGTPTVLVAGKQVNGANGAVPGPTDLTNAVAKAAG